MASINNIQIKNLKTFGGHEGETLFQGSIYYKNKKLGFWSQDAWSGPDNFDFNTKVLDEEVEKYKKSGRVSSEFAEIIGLESVLADLVNLMEEEKEFKKESKECAIGYLAANDRYHFAHMTTSETNKEKIKKSEDYREFKQYCKKNFINRWNGDIQIYTSLDDFNITV